MSPSKVLKLIPTTLIEIFIVFSRFFRRFLYDHLQKRLMKPQHFSEDKPILARSSQIFVQNLTRSKHDAITGRASRLWNPFPRAIGTRSAISANHRVRPRYLSGKLRERARMFISPSPFTSVSIRDPSCDPRRPHVNFRFVQRDLWVSRYNLYRWNLKEGNTSLIGGIYSPFFLSRNRIDVSRKINALDVGGERLLENAVGSACLVRDSRTRLIRLLLEPARLLKTR